MNTADSARVVHAADGCSDRPFTKPAWIRPATLSRAYPATLSASTNPLSGSADAVRLCSRSPTLWRSAPSYLVSNGLAGTELIVAGAFGDAHAAQNGDDSA